MTEQRPLQVGDILDDYCGGYFVDGYMDDNQIEKRIEAIGPDWVVAREIETGVVLMARALDPARPSINELLIGYRKEP